MRTKDTVHQQKTPVVQALLFRHVCALVVILGILSARHTFVALVCFALILWIDSRTWHLKACVFLTLCFGAGYFVYELRDTNPTTQVSANGQISSEQISGWQVTANQLSTSQTPSSRLPSWARIGANNRAPIVSLEGRVTKVQSLPDKRLRITLDEIRPFKEDYPLGEIRPFKEDYSLGETPPVTALQQSPLSTVPLKAMLLSAVPSKAMPLTSKLIWIWDQATTRPLIGQHLVQRLALKPIGGFANEGMFDSAAYWQNQNVWLRSWSRGKDLRILRDTARPDTRLREMWRRDVARSLNLEASTTKSLRESAGKSTNLPIQSKKASSLKPNEKESSKERSGEKFSKSRTDQSSHYKDSIPTQSAAIIMALLFGDKYYLSHETVELFRASGLSHSLALSGTHLSIAALLAVAFIALGGFFKPQIFEQMPRGKAILLMSVPFALFYLWLGSAPPSLVRASTMLGISAFLILYNRQKNLLDVLCLTLAIMVLANPANLFDLSVQLSFSALVGIALFLPIQQTIWQNMYNAAAQRKAFWQRIPRHILYSVMLLAIVSFAAQAGTFPISVYTFGTQSAYSFLNLLWLPFVSLWVLPLAFAGLFCTMLTLTSLGQGLLMLATWPCEAILYLLDFCTELGMDVTYLLRPSWSMAVAYVGFILALALRVGRTAFPASAKRCLVASVLLLCLTPITHMYSNYIAYSKATVRLRLLDTGQSQAVLIEWAKSPFETGIARMMIDGGGFNSPRFNAGSGILAPVLTQARFPHVDAMVLTHPDTDHMQGLIFLAEKFSVDVAYIPASSHRALTKMSNALARNTIPFQYIHEAKSVALSPHLRLDLLPAGTMKGNDGLAIRLVYTGSEEYGKNHEEYTQEIGLALIMGDMETHTQKNWLKKQNIRQNTQRNAQQNTQENSQKNSILQSQCIIVPHHGSARNVLPYLYDTIRPTIALAACGAGNSYGFPSKRLRDILAARRIALLSTADSGEITLTWHKGVLHDLRTVK